MYAPALGFLTGQNYAEEFFRITKTWPKQVPVEGVYPKRTWKRYVEK